MSYQSLESLECGKVYTASIRGDLPRAVSTLRYYAGMADKIHGKTSSVDGDLVSYSVPEPIGVCGLITAWNFPTFNITWKLAPALAAGNYLHFTIP